MSLIVRDADISIIPDRDPVPGVEIVLGTDTLVADVISPTALKLMGSLQRRVFDRRQTMVQRRSLGTTSPAESLPAAPRPNSKVLADFTERNSWKGRLNTACGLRHGRGVVRVRGWDHAENGVLVDGRPVMAPVFDVSLSMAARVDELRDGNAPFVLLVPDPPDLEASRLWPELVRLAEDRLGIERGTVSVTTRLLD